jgi:hypothetical protein
MLDYAGLYRIIYNFQLLRSAGGLRPPTLSHCERPVNLRPEEVDERGGRGRTGEAHLVFYGVDVRLCETMSEYVGLLG